MTKEVAEGLVEKHKDDYIGKRIVRLKDNFEFTCVNLRAEKIKETDHIEFSHKEDGWKVCFDYESKNGKTKSLPFNEVYVGITAGSTYKFI
jgi:hypothetical protein